jgi:hypothetical protein
LAGEDDELVAVEVGAVVLVDSMGAEDVGDSTGNADAPTGSVELVPAGVQDFRRVWVVPLAVRWGVFDERDHHEPDDVDVE